MKRMKKVLPILILSIIVVLITMQPDIIAAKKSPPPQPEAGNTSGNVSNYGDFAEEDGWIYFSNASNFGALTKCRADGSEMTVLTEDDVSSINVAGEWVYYNTYAGYFSIRKIKTDGTEKQEIREQRSFNLTVYGDWIYFTDTNLYRMKTDGTHHEMLEPEVTFPDDSWTHTGTIAVSDGWIFFQNYNEQALYRMRIDGSERSCVDAEIAPWSLQVFDGHLYYMNYFSQECGIYRSKLDGKDRIFIPINIPQLESPYEKGQYENDIIQRFNVTKDYIYIVTEHGKAIFRCDLQGKNLTKVSDLDTGAVCSLSQGMVFSTSRRAKYRIAPEGNVILFESDAFSDPSAILAEIEGWVYFIKKGEEDWNPELFRVRLDGSGLQKLTNEKLVVNDGTDRVHPEQVMIDEKARCIYYLHESGIRSIPLAGGKPKTVLKTDRVSSIVAIHDHWAYYLSSAGEYKRIRVDGKEKQVLAKGPFAWASAWLENDTIHGQFEIVGIDPRKFNGYIVTEAGSFVTFDQNSVHLVSSVGNIAICGDLRVMKDGITGDMKKLKTAGAISSVYKEWVYFCDEDNLYRQKYDGVQAELLAKNVQNVYHADDRYVFYGRDGEINLNKVFKLDLESRKSTLVGKIPFSNFGYSGDVVDGQFYYWGNEYEHYLIDDKNNDSKPLFAPKPESVKR